MIETNAVIILNKFLLEKEIKICEFISFVKHKNNESVYGCVFKTEKGLLYQKHKWIVINKNAKAPKICAETEYSHKFVEDNVWDHFLKIDTKEHSYLWMADSKNV